MKINSVCANCKSVMVFETGRAADIRCSACGSGFRRYEAEDNSAVLQARCLYHDVVFEIPMDESVEACHSSARGKCWKIIFEYGTKHKQQRRQPQIKKSEAWVKQNRVSIIILCWNKSRYTKACIKSIRQHTNSGEYRLVLVDNGSTDDTAEFLGKSLLEDDVLIRVPENIGFAKGNNLALKHADDPYVLFLNNDTQVQDTGWLRAMVAVMSKESYDLLSPLAARCWLHEVRDTNKKIYCFEKEIDDPMHPLGYAEGWCLMVKQAALKKLKGFDESFYPAYCEDVDFSWRAKKEGLRIGKARDIQITHYRGKSSDQIGNVSRLSEQMGEILYKKWAVGDNGVIVIRRDGAIGDVLMTTPIIRELRNRFPHSEIILETKCPQLLEGNPHLNRIVRKASVNGSAKIYNLSYESCPGEDLIEAMARQAGIEGLEDKRMECFLSIQKPVLPLPSPYVVVHTGASWPNKTWPLDRFTIVADWLIDEGRTIVQVGDNNTEVMEESPKRIDFRGKPWADVAAALRGAEFFLGIDSAPSNLAKAVGTATWIIYGCVDPRLYNTGGEEEHAIHVNPEDLDCFGCRNRSEKTYVSCTKPAPYCLTWIKPDDVIDQVGSWMEQREGRGA